MLGKLNNRHLILSIALLLTLIAVYFAPPEQTDDLVRANKVRTTKTTNDSYPVEQSGKKNRNGFVEKRLWKTEKSQNLFPSKIKPIPTPAILLPQAQLPPPIPVAPPLPFGYIGKVVEEGKPTVFVSKLQKNYLLKGGEIIEGTYRVDKVESGRVVFTYLPLESEQVMIIGGKD